MLHVHFRALLGAVFASLSLFTAVTLAANLAPLQGATAAGDCTADPSLDAEELVFLTLINNHRAQNGLGPLAASYTLSKAAQWKSQDMGTNRYFAHDDLTRTWVQRIRDCGYGYNAWLGENIAAGMSGGQAAFDIWKNSPGHNANMLSANFTAIGIGRAYVAGSPYGWYWSTEFGGYSDGWPAVTPVAGTATPTRTSTPAAASPTATRTRTPVAASPTATRTATAVAATMHAGDLDGSVAGKSRWNARVVVTVHDGAERPLAGARVTGRWDGGTTSACTTDTSGRCTLQSPKQPASVKAVALTITGLGRTGWSYTAASNHDPDGDSTGSAITVSR